MADAQLNDQQTAYDRGNYLQQTMLIIAIELQRANPAPINPMGIRKAKQDAERDDPWQTGLSDSF
ncbi:hypothetical protein [Parasphingorhabdus sp.]|uniref:hypothetical protein n=1 Tax=Parasphingorhabdus sp. TaxID=2709688 RepID=UPI003001CE5F